MKKITLETAEPILSYYYNNLKWGKLAPKFQDFLQDYLYFEWGEYDLVVVSCNYNVVTDHGNMVEGVLIDSIDRMFFVKGDDEYEIPDLFYIGIARCIMDFYGNIEKENIEPKNYGYY